MDLPPPVAEKSYDAIVKNIHLACSTVSTVLFRKAVTEEREALRKEGLNETEVVGKVEDILVKSSSCKSCEYWEDKVGSAEYEEWKAEHDSKCTANHTESVGKMEVDAIVEMFSKSEERHGIKYVNYIGDGDSKTYKGVLDAKLYGDGFAINKRECIGHVQKRMGTRLRQCVKKNKGVGGRNKLTGKMIDKLTIYYGLAIRRNSESVDRMRDAIWATYYHYKSNDEEPIHGKCPPGHD
ncbi:hypothetical protein J437_LFUL005803 [Ladona fulva]|uniref:Mutator-like transposase domain-containing protein n=1 Tax=Ladona fulva TaxID=123851 RepID=A0A8K0K0Q0_LADFU|nr:hypothetical protein J437_LFUL005803 [Ladona fulva]